jgi:hypothetical protein
MIPSEPMGSINSRFTPSLEMRVDLNPSSGKLSDSETLNPKSFENNGKISSVFLMTMPT